jgi:hypothetical protein
LPRYPEFENFDGLLELDSFSLRCNYFNNLENSLDSTHVGFVHRAHEATFDGAVESPKLRAEETDWGITQHATRGGRIHVTHFGMPNMLIASDRPPKPKLRGPSRGCGPGSRRR